MFENFVILFYFLSLDFVLPKFHYLCTNNSLTIHSIRISFSLTMGIFGILPFQVASGFTEWSFCSFCIGIYAVLVIEAWWDDHWDGWFWFRSLPLLSECEWIFVRKNILKTWKKSVTANRKYSGRESEIRLLPCFFLQKQGINKLWPQKNFHFPLFCWFLLVFDIFEPKNPNAYFSIYALFFIN